MTSQTVLTLSLPFGQAVVAEVAATWPSDAAPLVQVFIGPTLVLRMDPELAEDLADALAGVCAEVEDRPVLTR